jgi:VIT1/CCC1 family predicted Fe2+/Mn2+ transporter
MSDRENEPRPRGNGGWRPVPDPTVLTTEQLNKAIEALRDYVNGQFQVRDERLTGIDTATELRLTTIGNPSPEIDQKVGHLRELMDEKFDSVGTQFKERDTRSERESRDNKLAVDAAFAAQEKQAVAQQESNTLAINKSEAATAETIKTNQELSKSTTDTLTKSLDEVKLQVSRIESTRQGGVEQRSENRATQLDTRGAQASLYTLISTAVGVIGLIIAAYLATH